MIQPSRSGSQRLTTSPVYFTPLRFELLDQLRILDARRGERLACFASLAGCLSVPRIDLVADRSPRRPGRLRTSVLNSLYGDRLARPASRKYACASAEQQQEAEPVPQRRRRAGAERALAAPVAAARIRSAEALVWPSPSSRHYAGTAVLPLRRTSSRRRAARRRRPCRPRGTRPRAPAAPADRARGAGSSASAAARRTPDRSPRATSRSLAASVSSTWILRSSSRFISAAQLDVDDLLHVLARRARGRR